MYTRRRKPSRNNEKNRHYNRDFNPVKLSIKDRLSYKDRATKFVSGPVVGAQKKFTKGIHKVSDNPRGFESQKTLKLFTTHFDARNKLSKQNRNLKTVNPSPKNNNRGRKQKQSGLSVKALQELRQSNNIKSNKSAHHSSDYNYAKKTVGVLKRKLPDERESLFTGKSIKITTKNNLQSKEKRSLKDNKRDSKKKKFIKEIQNDLSIPSSSWHGNKERGIAHACTTDSFVYEARQQKIPVATNIMSPLPKKSVPAKVIISNLHPKVTAEDIKELFGAIGSLRESRFTNEGTAECTYESAEDAFAAYTKYHTRNLDGQPMVLRITTVDDSFPHQNQKISRTSPQFVTETRSPALLSGNRTATTSSKPVLFTVKL